MSNEQKSPVPSTSYSMMPSTSRQVEENPDKHTEFRKRKNCSSATTSSQISSSQPKKQRPTIPSVGEMFLPQEVDVSEESRAKYERWARKQQMLWSPVKQTSSSHKQRRSELEPHQVSEDLNTKLTIELKAIEQQRFEFNDAPTTSTPSTSQDSIAVGTSEETRKEGEQTESVLEPREEALIRGLMMPFLPVNRDPQATYAYAVLRPKEYLQKLPSL